VLALIKAKPSQPCDVGLRPSPNSSPSPGSPARRAPAISTLIIASSVTRAFGSTIVSIQIPVPARTGSAATPRVASNASQRAT
jgi:hypothetical protein